MASSNLRCESKGMIPSAVPACLVLIQYLCHCGRVLHFVFLHQAASWRVLPSCSTLCRWSMELNTKYFWSRDRTAVCCVKLAAHILVSRGRMTPLVFWWPETKRTQTNAFKEQLNVSLHPFNIYPNLQTCRSRRVTYTSVISVLDLLKVKAILSCLVSEVAAGTNCQTKPLSIVSNALLVRPYFCWTNQKPFKVIKHHNLSYIQWDTLSRMNLKKRKSYHSGQ